MSTCHSKVNRQLILANLVNCLECYDTTLYSFLATLLAPLFFPLERPGFSLLASFAALAVGTAMRPIGGIIFGFIGDKYGRRYAIKSSLFFIILPTLLISLLPTYQEIGALASFILITCLSLQGLCLGGEYSGTSVFVLEHTKSSRPGFWGGILISSGMMGSLIGTIIGYLCIRYFNPLWAWRLPFFIGGMIGLIFYHISHRLEETPDFQKAVEQKLVTSIPLLDVLRNHPINFLCAVCIGGATFIPLYIATTYFSSVLSGTFQIEYDSILLLCGIVTLIYVIGLPLSGTLSDSLGAKRIMIIGALGMIILPFCLFSLNFEQTVGGIILIQMALSIANVLFAGPALLFKAGLFPTKNRHTALGVGYNLGAAIFGGSSPLICVYLMRYTQNFKLVGLYLGLGGMLGLIGVLLAKKIDQTFESSVRT